MGDLTDSSPVIEGGTDGTLIGNVGDALKVSPALPVSGSSGVSFGAVLTAAATTVAVRQTVYTEQVVNAQRSIASSSVNDDSTPLGTGARTVRLTYLTVAGVGPLTEDITLNGTVYVNTVNTNICFIEKIEVLTAGTGGSNAGILTLKAAAAGAGVTIATVAGGDNRTVWAHHYVPVGKTCYVTGVSWGSDAIDIGSGALFALKKRAIGQTVEVQVSDYLRLYGADSGTRYRPYAPLPAIIGPAVLTMYTTPRSVNPVTHVASFDFLEN